jgi:transcription termination/antitermination protein NusG
MESNDSASTLIPGIGALAQSVDEPTESLQWYALYTLPRHEKTVARHFGERKIPHFLPLYQAVHNWNRRTVRVSLPLFPGYIFVKSARYSRGRILEVPGVVYFVGSGAVPSPIPNPEIEALRTIVLSGKEVVPHPYIAPGNVVSISHGPLAGLSGVVERGKSGNRFIVSIELIKRCIAVEIDGVLLDLTTHGLNASAIQASRPIPTL